MPSNKLYLSWDDIQADVTKIRTQMQEVGYVPARILALGRGAIVPARLLCAAKTQIFYEGVSSYEGTSQLMEVTAYQQCNHPSLNQRGTLVIDDLWDTGRTIRWAKMLWPEATYATLGTKSMEAHKALNFCGRYIDPETWVVYPWEIFDDK